MTASIVCTGEDCLRQLKNVPFVFGKVGGNKRKWDSRNLNWTKRIILFEFFIKISCCCAITLMSWEKNICDNLLRTVLDIAGKTKNTDKARLDLEDMNIWRELHLVESNGRCSKPPAAYVLSGAERRTFCRFLKSIPFSDGCASNLSRNIIEE